MTYIKFTLVYSILTHSKMEIMLIVIQATGWTVAMHTMEFNYVSLNGANTVEAYRAAN